MHLTDYQAKYFAHELTRRFPPDSVEKVKVALAGAQVDLNPHQIDAALFAFNSPLSQGALLADEVGLGKTIEAGLVLSQKWAERKRCILVITPASLRKQWYQELTEKFFLPCRLLESKSYNAAVKQGDLRPFQAPEITICSYHFAKSKAADVQAAPWDLVVIDEAHWLRNVYKPSNVIANTLKVALAGKDKLLGVYLCPQRFRLLAARAFHGAGFYLHNHGQPEPRPTPAALRRSGAGSHPAGAVYRLSRPGRPLSQSDREEDTEGRTGPLRMEP